MLTRTLTLSVAAIGTLLGLSHTALADNDAPRSGNMQIIDDSKPGLLCALENTEVRVHVAGFLTRVNVKQRFRNPTSRKIEAIYTFPLPQDAAVDRMLMLVGDRRVVGTVKEREEARRVYEEAKAAGHIASRLDQERPNIFTQAVANIEPGAVVEIELSYVETVPFADGQFTWTFPMVVGPRYNPGGGSAPAPMQPGLDTARVTDGSRITPPVAPEGFRAGHDISIEVVLAGGTLPVSNITSTLHTINATTRRDGAHVITLAKGNEIPNKDFILSYGLGGEQIGNTVLQHQDGRGAWVSLVLQPPARVESANLTPRELVFVLDTSGSMSGFPIEQAKEVIARLIDTMNPDDTFNLITFAGNTRILWEGPRANTPQNRQAAQEFLLGQQGGGGTEMMKAIQTALQQREPQVSARNVKPIRVVCFLTDGYVGNDLAIIDEVKRNADTTRVFSFGVGNSVNRFLMDGMAHAGRGEVEYVTLASQGEAAVKRFHERILAPVLTDVAIDWGNVPVSEVYPQQIPDVFSSKPIVVHAKLNGALTGSIKLHGINGAGNYEQEIDLSSAAAQANDSLASLWARAKVKDLMNRDLGALQRGAFPKQIKDEVFALGTGYQLVTQFTSFVAVEETTITRDGKPVTIRVPVEMPHGVQHRAVFGRKQDLRLGIRGGMPAPTAATAARGYAGQIGGIADDSRANIRSRRPAAEEREEDKLESLDEDKRKLDRKLTNLAKRVAYEGQHGNLAIDGLTVTTWRTNVEIEVTQLTADQKQQLQDLDVLIKSTKSATVYVASIDVRKLAEILKLEFVVGIKPA